METKIRVPYVLPIFSTFTKKLKRSVLQRQLKNILTEVKAFLNWCLRLEIIERVQNIPTITPPELTIKWLGEETREKILEVLPEEHKDIFYFLFTYGCRPAEARALAWDCMLFDERLIIFKRTFSGQKLV